MKPNYPPKAIYLQVHGVDRVRLHPDDLRHEETVDNGDVTWCEDKIFDTDVRYIIDRRYVKKRKRCSAGA